MPDAKARRRREEERTNITNRSIKKMMKKPTRSVANQIKDWMELKKRTMKMTKKRSKGRSKNLRSEKGSREKLRDSERKKLRPTRRLIYFASKKARTRHSEMT